MNLTEDASLADLERMRKGVQSAKAALAQRRYQDSKGAFHDPTGRFKANQSSDRKAPQNPLAGRTMALRWAFLTAVTPADISEITIALIEQAKAGNIEAIKEVFDRAMGKPVAADLTEQISRLEQAVEALGVSPKDTRVTPDDSAAPAPDIIEEGEAAA